MNEFRVFAHGETFDVDAFLASTTLRPDYVWRRGDRRRYCGGQYPTSGVEFVLGDGLTVPLSDQEDIAIAYLKAHHDELRALAQFPGVETFILRLQYHWKLEEGVVGFALGPTAERMWHALDTGVWPVYFVTLDRRREWEPEGD